MQDVAAVVEQFQQRLRVTWEAAIRGHLEDLAAREDVSFPSAGLPLTRSKESVRIFRPRPGVRNQIASNIYYINVIYVY